MNMNVNLSEKETQAIYDLVIAFNNKEKKDIRKLYAGKVSESSNSIYSIRMEKLEEGMTVGLKFNEDFYAGVIGILTKHAKKIKKIVKHVTALVKSIMSLNNEIEKDFREIKAEIEKAEEKIVA